MKLPALILISVLTLLSSAFSQTTAFTYQGQLRSNNAPANGHFDLQFSIFAASSGGLALTTPISNPSVEVSNGVFTILLDFGAGAYNGGIAGWKLASVRQATLIRTPFLLPAS